MTPDSTITHWIGQLQAGQQQAAQLLWERYFHHLVKLARKKLTGDSRAVADEEDVALSAFKSFCRAAEEGRFPELRDRDDLWKLLVTITERKAVNQVRDQRRLKRGGGKVQDEAALAGSTDDGPGMALVPGREPTPAFAALVAEECDRLLHKLDNDVLRGIALAKMEGYTNDEIGRKLDLALRSVERKLSLIRRIWEEAENR
jgi:DNA-directed RNA polymerase specialized sigma24 family protein